MAIDKQKIPSIVPINDPSNCETAVIIPIVPPFGNPKKRFAIQSILNKYWMC